MLWMYGNLLQVLSTLVLVYAFYIVLAHANIQPYFWVLQNAFLLFVCMFVCLFVVLTKYFHFIYHVKTQEFDYKCLRSVCK